MPQRLALFTIQAVDPLAVVSIAFATRHDVYTPASLVHPRVRDLHVSHGHGTTVASARREAIQRTRDHHGVTCLRHAYPIALHQIIHEQTLPKRLQNFFASRSCNIAMSNERSATRRLSRLPSPLKLAQPSQLRRAETSKSFPPVYKKRLRLRPSCNIPRTRQFPVRLALTRRYSSM